MAPTDRFFKNRKKRDKGEANNPDLSPETNEQDTKGQETEKDIDTLIDQVDQLIGTRPRHECGCGF